MSSIITWSTYVIVFGVLGILALRGRAKAGQAVKVAVRSFIEPKMLRLFVFKMPKPLPGNAILAANDP